MENSEKKQVSEPQAPKNGDSATSEVQNLAPECQDKKEAVEHTRHPAMIYPSIAAGNVLELGLEAKRLELSGADGIHFDVMDGHFVPLLTLGVPFIEALKKETTLPLDVHIMVTNPDAVLQTYLDTKPDCLTFPIETATHAHRLVHQIRATNTKAGIAINPSTSLSDLEWLVEDLDQITVMGVNPGFSRQKHIKQTLQKVEALKALCLKKGALAKIQVDGGVNSQNISQLYQAGADCFVAGGAVFGSSTQREELSSNLGSEKSWVGFYKNSVDELKNACLTDSQSKEETTPN